MAIKAKIKDGKKTFEVYINGFDKSGKRIQMRRRSIESIRKAELAEFELKRKLALIREDGVQPRWTEWVEDAKGIMRTQYKPSTMYTYEKTLKKWIPENWNDRDLKSFTRTDLHDFVYQVLPSDTTANTRKFVLKIVKRIFQLAIDHGKLDRNPCSGLMVSVPEAEKKVLTNSEVETFLKAAKETNHRFYLIWVAALFTGMRSGELYALKWTDIDFETGSISVSKSWSSKNGLSPTKNQKSRVVPVSDEFMAFLKELKIERGQNEFVLPHLKEWTRGGAAKVIKAFCKGLGIAEIRFHDLRATFITNLLARGVPLVQVMSIVGHTEMETTDVYLRKSGIDVKGSTESLGYGIPKDRGERGNVVNFLRPNRKS